MHLPSPPERFTTEDLATLTAEVASSWSDLCDADWSVPAGSLAWSCLETADHAVDCVYAPAFFLASRRTDGYPVEGADLRLGAAATPAALVDSLWTATRLLIGIVGSTPPETAAVLFLRPETITGRPADFPPRAALELALHAHDVASGMGASFTPSAALSRRLRAHVRGWPVWGSTWQLLSDTDDAWDDLRSASGRSNPR